MSIAHFFQHRPVRLLVWVLVVLLPSETASVALAQTQDEITAKLKEAETRFFNGDFDRSITIVQECLNRPDFPDAKRKQAYELLAQNYLAKSFVEQARTAIKKLLEIVPNYTPPPDSPEFAAQVEKVREEMGRPAQGERPQVEGAWYENPWVLVGGGVVVVAGLLIWSPWSKAKNQPPASQPLPSPPALP